MALDDIVYLLEEAFRGRGIEETNEAQSLLENIRTVGDTHWRVRPAGGQRTIESVVIHVATCKIMYDDHAFGAATRRWDDPDLLPWPSGSAPRADAIQWLIQAHDTLMGHVRGLEDEDLDRLRKTNWGEMRETRWLLSTLLQHDVYHAGEINHMRALLQRDDTWRWG